MVHKLCTVVEKVARKCLVMEPNRMYPYKLEIAEEHCEYYLHSVDNGNLFVFEWEEEYMEGLD